MAMDGGFAYEPSFACMFLPSGSGLAAESPVKREFPSAFRHISVLEAGSRSLPGLDAVSGVPAGNSVLIQTVVDAGMFRFFAMD